MGGPMGSPLGLVAPTSRLRCRVVATKRTSEPRAQRAASECLGVGWGWAGGGDSDVVAIDFTRKSNKSDRANSMPYNKGRRAARKRKESM